jgi:phage terminase large subunit-like protein
VKLVHASQGKRTRAEPVVAKYEQGRVKHPTPLPGLEEQMLSWDPARDTDSPDRVDALVWAITELMLANPWGGSKSMSGVA